MQGQLTLWTAEKRCRKCGQTKPAAEFHAERKNSPDGLQYWCKHCTKARYRARTERAAAKRLAMAMRVVSLAGIIAVECIDCGECLPVTEFYVRAATGKPYDYCKACNTTRTRATWNQHIEERRDYEKRRRQERGEQIRQVDQAWRDRNREWVRERSRAYYARNPDSFRKHAAARKARMNDSFVEHVDPLLVLERADGACGICGKDVDPFDFEVDHIVPIARGGLHSYANTQPAHRLCNRKKHARMPEELAA